MRNNNKEIVSLLARKSYQGNRRRNFILIGAVALAVMMLFCVFGLAIGKIETNYLLYVRNSGTAAYTTLERPTEEQVKAIQKLTYIKNVGKSVYIGEGQAFDGIVLDESGWTQMQAPAYTDIVGNYPQQEDEIMLPMRALENMEIKEPRLGMEIPVEIQLVNGDSLVRTFYLAGYYTEYVDPMLGLPDGYFSRKLLDTLEIDREWNTTLLIQQDDSMTDEYIENKLYEEIEMRDDSQQFWGGNSMTREAVYDMTGGYDISIAFTIAILVAAWLLIYNVMYISLNHDVRQYGLLKTLGTTKKQLYGIVFRQVGKIAVTGCIVGGSMGCIITIFLMPALLSKMYLHGVGSTSSMASFRLWIFVLAVLFGLLVTFISSLFAMHQVIRMSPMEAIRFVGGVKESKGKKNGCIKQRKHKILGEIPHMAWQNILRFRKRFVITVLSLTLGMIVSMTAVFIAKGTDTTHQIDYEYSDFSIMSYMSALESDQYPEETVFFSEELKNKIIGLTGIQKAEVVHGGFGKVSNQEEALSVYLENKKNEAGFSNLAVQALSDDVLKELEAFAGEEELPLDVEKVRKGEGVILLHYHLLSKIQEEQGKECIGKTIQICNGKGEKTQDMIFSGYLDFKKKGIPEFKTTWNGPDIVYFLVSEEGFQKMQLTDQTFGMELDVEPAYEPLLKDTLSREIDDYNRQYTESAGQYGDMIADSRRINLVAKSDILASAHSMIISNRIVMGALCTILVLMGLANYVNVTLTGLTMRRKEFAVMESIGLTQKQLSQMLILEGVFDSLIITLLTVSAGSTLLYFLNRLIKKRIAYFTYQYPVVELEVCIMVLFVFCMVVPLLVQKRYEKDSVVKRLRIYTD